MFRLTSLRTALRLSAIHYHNHNNNKTNFEEIPQWGNHNIHHNNNNSFSDPTNHVGEIGVMSKRATLLREMEEHNPQHDDDHDHGHSHHSHNTDNSKKNDKHTKSPFLNVMRESLSNSSFLTSKANKSSFYRWTASDLRQKKNEAIQENNNNDENKKVETAKKIERPSHNNHNNTNKKAKRHSGVQREILLLYRHLLKETLKFRDTATRVGLYAYIKADFELQGEKLKRTQINNVEWQINYGKRKLSEIQRMTPDTKFSIKH